MPPPDTGGGRQQLPDMGYRKISRSGKYNRITRSGSFGMYRKQRLITENQRRNSSSRYFGNGQIWSSTISSNLSMWRRISSKQTATVSW